MISLSVKNGELRTRTFPQTDVFNSEPSPSLGGDGALEDTVVEAALQGGKHDKFIRSIHEPRVRPMRYWILTLLLPLLFLSPTVAEPAPIADGFYRVLRTCENSAGLKGELAVGEQVLRYNPTFLEQEDNEEEVVVVQVEPHVPMLLKEPPSKVQDRTERTQFWLGVSLTPDASESLESFTRDNLGQRVAIVAGGEVITMHKIREVIRGGKVQISRCGDRGCEVLFRELQDNVR